MDQAQVEQAVSGITNAADKARMREILTNHVEVSERGTFIDPSLMKEVDEIRGRAIVGKATGRLYEQLTGLGSKKE